MSQPVGDPFLSADYFMPHGHCYLWIPELLWTQVIANLLIGLAYFSIPVALWMFVRQRTDLQDLRVKSLFIMFSLFILFCGTTHFIDILVIWKPYYWLDAAVRILTALLSIATAALLWPQIPKLLALPSPLQLQTANQNLEAEIRERQARELEIQALNQDLEQRVDDRTQELIQRTEEAEIANRSKTNFLATISHELRTPLNAIIGYSELMLEDLEDTERVKERQEDDLKQVRSSALHLLNLINEVLDLSRIEANKITVISEAVQIPELLEDLRLTILPLAEANRNRFEASITSTDLTLVSDAHRLKQILLNLLSNACKFTHDGLIELEAGMRDGQACFSVRDSGIGIQTEHLERIFDMFYQADSSYGRKYMGTGLGLTIARDLTKHLSGRLEVSSQPDQGTLFTVLLPLSIPAGATEIQV